MKITGAVVLRHLVEVVVADTLVFRFDAAGAAAMADMQTDPAWQQTVREDALLGLVRAEQRLRHYGVATSLEPAPNLPRQKRLAVAAAIKQRRAELARRGLVAFPTPPAGHA